jgi:hypothetical protein
LESIERFRKRVLFGEVLHGSIYSASRRLSDPYVCPKLL